MEPTSNVSELTVSVVANEPVTKDIITAGFLDDKSEVGVAMYNDDLGSESGVSYHYHNVKFTAAGTAENQVWTPEQPIFLGETVGTAYAYYPYNEVVTNVEEIPVTTVGQTDYLYAKQENLSNTATNATFPMNHGLAVISMKVVRGSYPGVGSLTKAEVRGPGICTAGKLNAKTGELHSFEGKAEPVAVNTAFTIDTEGDVVDVIVVPNGETGSFRITLTIDGVEYMTTTTEIKLEAGCRYHYTVTANERQVVLSAVTIGDWGYSDAGDPTILVGGYSITLAGDLTGLAFNSVVNESTVTIEARPKTAFWVPVSITASEGVAMTQEVATDGLITLNLSEITANVVVTFVGYKVDLVKNYTNCVISKPVINSSHVISFDVAPIRNFWVPNISYNGSGTLSQTIASDGKVSVTLSGVNSNTSVSVSGYSITYSSGSSNYMFRESINNSKVVTIKAISTKGVGVLDLFVPTAKITGSATMSTSSLTANVFSIQLSSVSSNIVISLNGYKVTVDGNIPTENITASFTNGVGTWIVDCPYTLGTLEHWVPYVTHSGSSSLSTTINSETQYQTTLSNMTKSESLSLNGYKVSAGGDMNNLTVTSSYSNGVATYVAKSTVDGRHPRYIPPSLFSNSQYIHTIDVGNRSATYEFSTLTNDIVIPFSGTTSYVWSVQTGSWTKTTSELSIDGCYYTCSSPNKNQSTVIRCTFSGVSSITFSFRGQGESGCDYLTVGHLDTPCTRQNYSLYVPRSSEFSTKTYTCDGGEHYVEFCYSKDGVDSVNPDNAEVYISDVTY